MQKKRRINPFLLIVLCIGITIPSLHASEKIEKTLVDTLKLDWNKTNAIAAQNSLIKQLKKQGYINQEADDGSDYSYNFRVNKPLSIFGNQVLIVTHEHMSHGYIGCCVDPGISITVDASGDTTALKKIAKRNSHCRYNDIKDITGSIRKFVKTKSKAIKLAGLRCATSTWDEEALAADRAYFEKLKNEEKEINPAKGTHYTIASPSLSLRAKPNKNAKKIAKIPYGSAVNFLKKTSIRSKAGGHLGEWIKISWNNKTGYVFGAYLSPFKEIGTRYNPKNHNEWKGNHIRLINGKKLSNDIMQIRYIASLHSNTNQEFWFMTGVFEADGFVDTLHLYHVGDNKFPTTPTASSNDLSHKTGVGTAMDIGLYYPGDTYGHFGEELVKSQLFYGKCGNSRDDLIISIITYEKTWKGEQMNPKNMVENHKQHEEIISFTGNKYSVKKHSQGSKDFIPLSRLKTAVKEGRCSYLPGKREQG